MTVRLMLTCLCDAYFGEVGIATVKILEHLGCKVEFPSEQTCCGQPPFNAGDWKAARKLVLRTSEVFQGSAPVVTPSGSCAAMIRHGYSMLVAKEPFSCFELCEFLVGPLGVSSWPPPKGRSLAPRKIAFHSSCHNRVLQASRSEVGSPQRKLLESVAGIEIVSFAEEEQCCGFGGAFAATHGSLSSSIGLRKLEQVVSAGTQEIVGGDMGCLMHLDGLIRKHELPLRVRHIAELLAEAIP